MDKEIVIIENRLYILGAIVYCSVFCFSLFWTTSIFVQPIIEGFSDLNIKELLLFGSTSILTFIGFIILCLSTIFMLIKLFIPAKLVINDKGIKYGYKQTLVEWQEIADIRYFSIKNSGKKLIWLWLALCPMSGFNGILQAIRCLLLLQAETGGFITILKSNKQTILLTIDESFVSGEEKVIDILKACRKKTVRREYLSSN